MGSTILDILRKSESRLAAVDSPRLSAEILMSEVLGCSRLDLVIDRDRVLNDETVDRINVLVARRASGEPIAYILGRKEFYGLDFIVSPDTLIPRPETEHIIEEVETRFDAGASFRFADLGTGSGILAVMIAHLFPFASGFAVDMSREALHVAEKNAKKHGVADRIEFVLGDFTTPLFEASQFDLVVSNPPYVTHEDYENASFEVTEFEPRSALVSGVDGLDHIAALLPRVVDLLKSGGLFLMEIGWQQGGSIIKTISSDFPQFEHVMVQKDLAGHDRIIVAQKL